MSDEMGFCFFFQAEDGIRDLTVTGVQTCALPIFVELDLDRTTASLSDLSDRHDKEERAIEQLRQQQFETVGREARLRNEVSSRNEISRRLTGQIERLEREQGEAREQTTVLEQQLDAA